MNSDQFGKDNRQRNRKDLTVSFTDDLKKLKMKQAAEQVGGGSGRTLPSQRQQSCQNVQVIEIKQENQGKSSGNYNSTQLMDKESEQAYENI